MSTTAKQKRSLSRRRRIARRLAAYSIAGGAIALAGQAQAGVSYVQMNLHPDWITHPTYNPTKFGPETGTETGIFTASHLGDWAYVGADHWFISYTAVGYNANKVTDVVAANAAIAPNANFVASRQVVYMRGPQVETSNSGNTWYAATNTHNAEIGKTYFYGLKFALSDGTHYGWVKYSVAAYGNGHDGTTAGDIGRRVTFEGYAYETQVGKSIRAGSTTSILDGDADANGTVNGADLNTVLSNYNKTTGMDWTTGDFDNNGTVNGADLNIVLSNYNGIAGVTAAVPEPASLGMLALGAVGVLAWKGWRKRK